jgi:threonine dehydrogenase-like Zn-dependent dehydrogenase
LIQQDVHQQTIMASSIPSQHRALQLESIDAGLRIVNLPTPKADLGSAIVRIEAASVLSYHRDIYNGVRHYSFPIPLVGGSSAIGRIVALGPDATILQHGQLVYVDCVIKARDNPDTLFLSAIHDSGAAGSAKLMRNVWRDGTFAKYAKVPLENCFALDEARLCGSLGYTIPDLTYMSYLLVAFGGLRDINLEPGETIVISPATGGYGGAGVRVAIAMGARVIAAGRNEEKLAALQKHVVAGSPYAEIETMVWTGDEADDTKSLTKLGIIDAVLDFTPPQASKSLHLRSATSALRRNGRVSLMGFVDQPVVPWSFVGKNLTIKGKLMYERSDIVQFIKMLERGLFPRGTDFVDTRSFELGEWKEGFDVASEHTGIGKQVVFIP